MRRPIILFGILVAALSTSRIGLAEPPRYANANDDAPPLERAQRALDLSEWQAAYDTLLPLWQRAPSPALAVKLGRSELGIGMARDAAEHFAYALRELPPSEMPARFFAESGLQRSLPFVVSLRVHTRSGAEVFIDGSRVGAAPLAGDVFVDEGDHTVEARLAGFSTPNESFYALMGSAWRVDLELVPIAPSNVPAPIEPAVLKRSRSAVPTIVGSILTAGMLSVSSVFAIALAPGSGDPAAMRRDAAICDGVALAIAGATLTYTLWPVEPKRPTSVARIAPFATPGGLGLSFGGSM